MTTYTSARGADEERTPPLRGSGRRRPRWVPRARALGLSWVWAYALLSLFPLVWLLGQSFKADVDFFARPWSFDILNPKLEGYVSALEYANVGVYFLNSVVITAATVTITIVTTVAAGYALSQLPFPGRRLLFVVVLFTMLIPAPVLLLPVFIISDELGLLNTRLGLLGPYVAGALPIGLYLVKTAFDAAPSELRQAARVDGCNEWQIFRMVMVPLIRPVAATIGVLAFMGSWDEYIWAFISLRDAELFTLPVGIVDLASKVYTYGYNTTFAAMVMSSAPVILAFVVAQRSFVQALTAGAVKG